MDRVLASRFQPRLSAEIEYQEQLLRQPPKSTATLSLLAANVLLFTAAAFAGAGWIIPNATIEITAGSNLGSLSTRAEWWRLITSLFVHFGVIHLLFSMWALAAFGALAERLFGFTNFLFIYFVSGIAANLASIAFAPDVNTAGASEALCGTLGALLVAYWRNKRTLPFSIVRSKGTSVFVFVSLALLGNAADLGGLVTGFLLGVTLSQAKVTPAGNMPNRLPTLGALSLLLATVVLACGVWFALHPLAGPSSHGI